MLGQRGQPCHPTTSATTLTLFDFPRRLGYNVARIQKHSGKGHQTLANTQSAIKRIRSSERKRRINQVHRSQARTYVKRTRSLIAAGQLDDAEVAASRALAALDKAAQKGVIHKNNAARRKSRLMKQLNQAKNISA